MKIAVLGLAAAAGLAGSAHATFFSFASDTADRQWTFAGHGSSVTQGDANGVRVDLILNDDNGGTQRVISTRFYADWTLSYVGSMGVGSAVSHTYRATGSFQWVDAETGGLVLRGDFQDAIFTAGGSAGAWSSTATVMGSDEYTSFGYTSGINAPEVGLYAGALGGPQDFGFTLTVINTSGQLPYVPNAGNRGVALGEGMLPGRNWWSEGSFSGSAVPTPGSMALVGMGGLMCFKRRRK